MGWDGTARNKLLPTQLRCDAPSVPGEPVRQLAAGQGGAVQKLAPRDPLHGLLPEQIELWRPLHERARATEGSQLGQAWLSKSSKLHGTLILFPGARSSTSASQTSAGGSCSFRAS
ncbi:hypothetical protein H8958_012495 [Nasalis larvatus]|uniref:uncharacterized protein LOC104657760 n=1 Tax=Rhinopithecus roxellana TaxID=61622 RepID=UPI000533585C|nr:uncharacterized protein LOC104657760 [Rhinopithecus roxellana]XP_011757005.1 uncharacterized protein LOC105491931 [Macaca nemestrina]XP_014995878.1 uncharacterized protein LOC106998841 [Macaca mulatta]XP_017745935.1 PREDICTED: uncharacterized protein LOC108541035 [Rhinopithecus bieti]